MNDKSVTINLTKGNYSNQYLKFKKWEIIQLKGFPYSSKKRYNIVTKDSNSESDADSTTHTISLHGLNISKWWLIRYVQLRVLKTVFKI